MLELYFSKALFTYPPSTHFFAFARDRSLPLFHLASSSSSLSLLPALTLSSWSLISPLGCTIFSNSNKMLLGFISKRCKAYFEQKAYTCCLYCIPFIAKSTKATLIRSLSHAHSIRCVYKYTYSIWQSNCNAHTHTHTRAEKLGFSLAMAIFL